MGCPAKKVCNAWAGSALLKDESLVARILGAVVDAVDVPVTLKIRTGWDSANRNGIRVARIAADAGVQALAVHGRTRDMLYTGEAEYETIAAIKQAVRIPVIANGDVTSPQKAREVLAATGADPDHSEREERMVTFGISSAGRLLVVAHTERRNAIRIISARVVTQQERRIYEEG